MNLQYFQYVGTRKSYPDQSWKAESSIGTVRDIVQKEGPAEANVVAFFCKDTASYGTVGIAYTGVLCDKSGHQVSLNEWSSTTAATGMVNA